MSSIPKLSYLKDSMYYTCKKTSRKKKMLNIERRGYLATGSYINNLCSVPFKDRVDFLNKMVDAKFKPQNLKGILLKTINRTSDAV